ncbi:MAG: hypothetical protein WCY05_00270 [Candidatus Omnitrophota bacterium]
MSNLRGVCRKLLLLICFLGLPHSAFAVFVNVQDIDDAHIKRIAISPFDENLIYVGSKNALFKSINKGKKFQKIYVFKDEELSHINFDSVSANTAYVAATRHLYKITDKIDMVFRCADEDSILCVAKYKDGIYVGTTGGLYFSSEDILKWQKIGGLTDAIAINYIEPAEDGLYLATNKGIYFLKDKDNIKRIFVLRDQEVEGEEGSGIIANIVKVDIFDKNKIWLGATNGIFLSKDKGENWNKLYLGSLDSLNIVSLAQTKLEENSIYAGTLKGFFKADLKANSAKQIFEGIYSDEIFWVAFSPGGEIYLATSKGLFESAYFSAPSNKRTIAEVLKGEPSIREIQQAAIRYNETSPDKIKQWRQAVKVRALMPTLKLDYDKTITTALGATYERVNVGPLDWGVSFSWDIADLVWNTHETDIDTRSRLNTQLRLDILDEINRVYFERLRVKREIVCNNLPEEEFCQKDLRLQELTAIIDGYTGGYFSKRITELETQQCKTSQ